MTKEEFIGLIKKYKGQMYRFAFSIVKNETDAEDVVAETIKKAYENLNKLKNKGKFKRWITETFCKLSQFIFPLIRNINFEISVCHVICGLFYLV